MPRRILQRGQGVFCKDSIDLFPGEKHPFDIQPCGVKNYNFLGPGTQVDKRLQRGDKPINDLDEMAMRHDMVYNNLPADKNKRIAMVKNADDIFMESARASRDAPIMGKIASKAIMTKLMGEDIGILPRSVFSGGADQRLTKGGADPCAALRKKHAKELQKTTGGFLLPLAASLLGGLAIDGVKALYDHFTKKGGADDQRLTNGEQPIKTKYPTKKKMIYELQNVPYDQLHSKLMSGFSE